MKLEMTFLWFEIANHMDVPSSTQQSEMLIIVPHFLGPVYSMDH